jgi:hypothetical protein
METAESLRAQVAELQEQLAFWIGEGNNQTIEELEWLTLQRISPETRTKQQSNRLRELGRFIMEADADYWRNRAAKAEAKLREQENANG